MVFHQPLALIPALQADLCAVTALSPDAFDRFGQLIPDDWIEQALQATGTASLRRRRLPAERLIGPVIGLALFRSEPVWHIVRQLGLALDSEARAVPVPSATVHGRQRLGEAPLAHLFDQISHAWCDAPRYPADQVAACHRERWEIELGFREIKQGMLDNDTVLRSKRPDMVRREVWDMLIAYNLLRREIHQTAKELDVPPTRLSVQGLTRAIVAELRYAPLETPGALPKRLARLRQHARVYLLQARRKRSCHTNSSDTLGNTHEKMPVSSTDWH